MNRPSHLSLCPICAGSSTAVPHWSKPCFSRCRDCGAIFRSPFPSEAQLNDLYRESWADLEMHIDETGGTSRELGCRMLAALLRELGRADFSGQRILDFGAGRGGMSSALRDLDADVVAIEPYGYRQLQHLGISVHRDLDDLPAAPHFDGVVAMEVVEHLRDPCDLLRRLQARLKPGGWIFLTTPNPRGLAALLRGRHWKSAANRGHILFFTARTLHRVLSGLGFATVRRTRWNIRLPEVSPARAAVHWVLQQLHLDGGLRFLAVNSPTVIAPDKPESE